MALASSEVVKTFLHIGCGSARGVSSFDPDEWREVRVDIDPGVEPDVLCSMTDMTMIDSESAEVVFSQHAIEHLRPDEVVATLKEFKRVLKPDGVVMLTCPDLQVVCEEILAGRMFETLYESESGPIAPVDMLFGHRGQLQAGNSHMAHKMGFTKRTLEEVLRMLGFNSVVTLQDSKRYELWAFASVKADDEARLVDLVYEHLFNGVKHG